MFEESFGLISREKIKESVVNNFYLNYNDFSLVFQINNSRFFVIKRRNDSEDFSDRMVWCMEYLTVKSDHFERILVQSL